MLYKKIERKLSMDLQTYLSKLFQLLSTQKELHENLQNLYYPSNNIKAHKFLSSEIDPYICLEKSLKIL